MTQRRTTTGLVDMEHSLGISADDTHESTTRSQSCVNQEHPTRPTTSESPAKPSLWPAEVLYEHDFYTDVWYTDIVACILILVYACGVFIVYISGGDFGRQSVVVLIIPSTGSYPYASFARISFYMS